MTPAAGGFRGASAPAQRGIPRVATGGLGAGRPGGVGMPARGGVGAEMESILVERPPDRPGLMVVTLNRPAKLNAITTQMQDELQRLCLDLQNDVETRVVILTGAGRAFSAGADTSGSRQQGTETASPVPAPVSELEQRRRASIGNRTCALLEGLEQVTIGAINGLTIGGAVSIAGCLDLRLAAESAWFSIPEVDLGIPIAWNALPRLMRELGPARTRELVMTGNRFSSADAERWGFVNHAVPDAELMPRALALAEMLLAKPPMVLAILKSATTALAQSLVPAQVVHSDRDLLLLAQQMRANTDAAPPVAAPAPVPD